MGLDAVLNGTVLTLLGFAIAAMISLVGYWLGYENAEEKGRIALADLKRRMVPVEPPRPTGPPPGAKPGWMEP